MNIRDGSEMTDDQNKPETLEELLVALEKSPNLRSLSRECGLTPGDLKRRLKMWRRQLKEVPPGDDAAAVKPRKTASRKKSPTRSDLVPASAVTESPLPEQDKHGLEIWTDGASRGNPGPASVGIVFAGKGGTALCGYSETIGKATNNVAEYSAVLTALKFVNDWGIKRVTLNLDSELVARQLTGQYRVKSPDLIPLYRQIVALSRKLDAFKVRHVRREKNRDADELANLALDGQPLK